MVNLCLTNKVGQITSDSDTLNLIREHFSVANPAYRKQSRFTPSRLYAITPSGKFDLGLTNEIADFLKKNYFVFNIDEELKREFNCGYENPHPKKLNIQYRDYQETSIIKSIKQGRGISVIPTAGGKTLICAGLIETMREYLNDPEALVLVTVPSIQLVEQTANDFYSYGLKKITKWSGNNKLDFDCNIIVAGTQFLLSKKTDLSILADVKILLMDECHNLRRGNEINKILKLIRTPHRFGFTGTMPSTKIDEWNIIGKLGPITFEQKTNSLKQQDYISNFRITIINIHHAIKPSTQKTTNNPIEAYKNELEFLINCEMRNDIIIKLSHKLSNNTLIMVDRIPHGELLEAKLKTLNLNKKIYFIRGSTEIECREEIRSFMNERNDVIVIAISKIFSTGINIPNLHNIIFASAGKSKIKIMQSIGRALRLHHTKTMANIFDISDDTKYSRLHLIERKKLYDLEKYDYVQKEIN